MSKFTYNENEVQEPSKLVTDGYYEGVIKLELKTSNAGKEYISVSVRLRDDIDQQFKNRVIFDMIPKDKNNENEFLKWKVFRILKAIDCPDSKTFEDYDEYVDFVTGSFLRIKVGTKFDNYSNENKNVILEYTATQFPTNTLVSSADVKETPVPEDDLPF